MANAREILDRMKSIQDTMKITNAMYMISSSKLKKARASLDETEPYFYSMQMAIGRILRHVPDMKSEFFNQRPEIKPEDRKVGYIVVTADKGLAGSYNHNILLQDLYKVDLPIPPEKEVFRKIILYSYKD